MEPESVRINGDASVVRRHDVPREEVAHPDEIGDEMVLRMLVQLERRAHLLEDAEIHDADAVAHRQRLLLAVRHEDERLLQLMLEPPEFDLHLLPELLVERVQHLVEEQDFRRDRHAPGDRDALALAAGEFPDPAFLLPLEVHEPEHLLDPLLPLLFVDPVHFEAVLYVLLGGHVREQRVLLEDEARVPPVRRDPRHVLARDDDVSGIRGLQAGQDLQEG